MAIYFSLFSQTIFKNKWHTVFVCQHNASAGLSKGISLYLISKTWTIICNNLFTFKSCHRCHCVMLASMWQCVISSMCVCVCACVYEKEGKGSRWRHVGSVRGAEVWVLTVQQNRPLAGLAAHRKYKARDLFVNINPVFCLFKMSPLWLIVGRQRKRHSKTEERKKGTLRTNRIMVSGIDEQTNTEHVRKDRPAHIVLQILIIDPCSIW